MNEQLGFDLEPLDHDSPDHCNADTGIGPPDDEARRRIRDDLAATLFVEAGAGAGKTSSLVARIVHLVESGVDIKALTECLDKHRDQDQREQR